METDAAPAEFARQDLTEAVEIALARDGHLLTAGEWTVARRFLALPPPAEDSTCSKDLVFFQSGGNWKNMICNTRHSKSVV